MTNLQEKPQDKTEPVPAPAAEPITPASYAELFQDTSALTKSNYIIGVIAASISGSCFNLLVLCMGQIYDEHTEEDEDDYDMFKEETKMVLIMAIGATVLIISAYVASVCFTRVSQAVGLRFRTRYYHAALAKDINYFDLHNSAELPGRMNQDCEAIEGATGEKMMFLYEIATYCLLGMAIVMYKSPQLFLVGFSILPYAFGGMTIAGIGMTRGQAMQLAAYNKAGAVSEEALADVKTVASFNAQDYVADKYERELAAPQAATSKVGAIMGLGWGIVWSSWLLSAVLIFWTSVKWVNDERKNWIWGDVMEGADVVVAFWVVTLVCLWLGGVVPGVSSMLAGKLAGGRALQFISESSAFANGSEQRSLHGNVEFQDVHFAYPKAPDVPILRGLSFSCEAGQKTAIVGESGAGKSTIVQLLERFYEPQQGAVLYDGIPASAFDITALRKQLGYVSQEPVLFNLTIEENIKLGYPEATAEEVEAAAKEAHAFDFIASLQDGFATEVGPKGSRLSGGQKQRIAIARALIKKPKIMLLDEATSALDNESEHIVLRAMDSIHTRTRMTIISVAQKLSTIRYSDKIVVLREGRALEQGSHDQLVALNGAYSEMYAAQGAPALMPVAAMTTIQSASSQLSSTNTEDEGVPKTSAIKSLPLFRILKATKPYWPLLVLALIATVICGAILPIFGYILAKLTWYITGKGGDRLEDRVREYSLWLIGLAVVLLVSFFLMQWSMSLLQAYVTRNLRKEVFTKLLHMDGNFMDSANPGLLSMGLSRDTELVNAAGGPMLSFVIIIAVCFCVSLGIAFFWQWQLACVMIFIIPIECLAYYNRFIVKSTGLSHPRIQNALGLTSDSILNIKTVHSFMMQDALEQSFKQQILDAYEKCKWEAHWNGLGYGAGLGFMLYGVALAFFIGGYLEVKDQAGGVDVTVVVFTHIEAVMLIGISAAFASDVSEGSKAATRVYKLLDYVPMIDSQNTEGATTEIRGQVTFSNVSFKYPSRDNLVLQGVSFDVQPGRCIGVTGASGSGKSTLSALLLRFYEPIEGMICVDGVDIRTFNIKHLRSTIALVGQEPVLFSGSVRSNVDFGMGRSDAEIRDALVHASLPKFADDLDKEVGVRGGQVSGGQKQRLAIARALLRSPKILMLDEATSALDSKTELKIMEALEYAGRGRTVILVAHRLSTIAKCDEILVMDSGIIKEKGTHAQLRALPEGIYQRLLAASGLK